MVGMSSFFSVVKKKKNNALNTHSNTDKITSWSWLVSDIRLSVSLLSSFFQKLMSPMRSPNRLPTSLCVRFVLSSASLEQKHRCFKSQHSISCSSKVLVMGSLQLIICSSLMKLLQESIKENFFSKWSPCNYELGSLLLDLCEDLENSNLQ